MRKGILFDEFFSDTYLPAIIRRKRSWAIDERVWRQYLSPKFGRRPIAAIDGNEVEDWQRGLAESGLAPATCNRYLAVLRSVFVLALRRGLLERSPCENVRRFREPPSRERFLPREMGRRLLAYLSGNPRPEARAVALLLLTGARKREILNARWEDIDFGRGLLTVRISKSNRTRHIPLSERAMAILREIPADSPWIFPNSKRAGPLADIYRFWNGVRQELGLLGYRIHDLRHSFASYLVNAGHTLYETQRALGHASPVVTMRYAHLAENALRKCAETVGALLAPMVRDCSKNRRRRRIWGGSLKKAAKKKVVNGHFLCRFACRQI